MSIPLTLAKGYGLFRDADGDYWLQPPANITLFSEPGEAILLGTFDCPRETHKLQDWINAAMERAQ